MAMRTGPQNTAWRVFKRRGLRPGAASGQSLVEVGLLLPFLLLLLLGVIEVGRFAYFAILVGNAAHAGAFYGSQNPIDAADSTGITTAACNDYQGTSTCALTVSSTYVCQCDDNGSITADAGCAACPTGEAPGLVDSVQVTASGTFSPLFNYPGISQTITVSRTATMRIE